MTAQTGPTRATRPTVPRRVSLWRTLAGLRRDPLGSFEQTVRAARGDIVRLNLGLFSPYLVTHPDHVQHVLKDHPATYTREGMFWKPLKRLFGRGILVDGPDWEPSRRRLQPMFASRTIEALMAGLTDTVRSAVDELHGEIATGAPLDAGRAMASIVHRTIARVFFGDRISRADIDRLIPAIDAAGLSVRARLILPSVPHVVPLPGDRAFRRAVRDIDAVMYPLIRACRQAPGERDDVVSMLCRSTDDRGRPLTDQQVRDDVVSMFAAGTETTATALTWLWVALDANPTVAGRLFAEIDRVVGGASVTAAHLPKLAYTRMVLQELVRLYPVGWLIPRTATRRDVIGRHVIKPGSTILISPYLTQRLDDFFHRPTEFDPERFRPENARGRHRYAYFPFGGGPHQCLGAHLFTIEAELIAATILGRYRPELANATPVTALPAASLRPREPVLLRLHPIETIQAMPRVA